MKFIKKHIIFLLAAIGLLTSTAQTVNPLESTSFLAEFEIEEVFDEESELFTVWKDVSIEKNNDGGSGIINEFEPCSNITYLEFLNSHHLKSNLSTNKVAYFILYCCLKINC